MSGPGPAGSPAEVPSAGSVLVTGAAGFIGFHTAEALLRRGTPVVGYDELNDYYDVALKQARLDRLVAFEGFSFVKGDVADQEGLEAVVAQHRVRRVVHLAAQPGARYSLERPGDYGRSNLTGFLSVLECCRGASIEHLVFASSSSVYGMNRKQPFSVDDGTDHPISLYAATKKSNELMAHAYAHLFGLPATGLRFFTVYGPWGRPDMAYYLFTDAIARGRPIQLFDGGRMRRDLTYVDDVVEGIVAALDAPPSGPSEHARDVGGSDAPFRLYNLGSHAPTDVSTLIRVIERAVGREAETITLPMQPGDVPATFADISESARVLGFEPSTSLEEGIARFVAWYRSYHAAGH